MQENYRPCVADLVPMTLVIRPSGGDVPVSLCKKARAVLSGGPVIVAVVDGVIYILSHFFLFLIIALLLAMALRLARLIGFNPSIVFLSLPILEGKEALLRLFAIITVRRLSSHSFLTLKRLPHGPSIASNCVT